MLKLMRLSPKPRRGPGYRPSTRALTTEPGFVNPNRQMVVASTGAASGTRSGQMIYRVQCTLCRQQYGCNGLDIKARLCPYCQGGVPGEPLRETAPLLDFSEAF